MGDLLEFDCIDPGGRGVVFIDPSEVASIWEPQDCAVQMAVITLKCGEIFGVKDGPPRFVAVRINGSREG